MYRHNGQRLFLVSFDDHMPLSSAIVVMSDCEQDAVDDAADWAEKHAPGYVVDETALADYGPDAEGIVFAGNHGLPFDSQNLSVIALDSYSVQTLGELPKLRPVNMDAESYLAWAIAEDHPGAFRFYGSGCDNTCDIAAACELELYRWAAHILNGATECPYTADALEWVAELDGDAYQAKLDAERDELCEAPHVKRPSCESILWYPGEYEPLLPDSCGNCGHDIPKPLDEDEDELTA